MLLDCQSFSVESIVVDSFKLIYGMTGALGLCRGIAGGRSKQEVRTAGDAPSAETEPCRHLKSYVSLVLVSFSEQCLPRERSSLRRSVVE